MNLKKITSLLSILLLTIFITACGATTTEKEKTSDPSTTETVNTGETKGDSESTAPPTEVLEGTQITSDGQNYSITVVDGYELTGEEPNKDLLFNKENDKQSMRIETFKAEEVNLEDITNNLVETLKASNEEGTLEELTDESQLPAGELIEQVKGFQIDTPDGKVSGYTFEKEGLIVKLIIFDTTDKPALEKFVQMAETIELSK